MMIKPIPSNMDDMIAALPLQIVDFGTALSTQTLSWPRDITSVYIAGMGGSGIGGAFASEIARPTSQIPIVTGQRYSLPAWVDSTSLVILSTYSGGTEETLMAMDEAIARGAMLAVISSGGKALQRAQSLDCPYVQLPDGWSSPRACLGFSLMAQVHLMASIGALGRDVAAAFIEGARQISARTSDIRDEARDLAATIGDTLPVIYSDDRLAPVALRWRQQIQENAKRLAWHHTLPEMNHNELVGWAGSYSGITAFMLRHSHEAARVATRLDLTTDIISAQALHTHVCQAVGDSYPAQLLHLVHLGDWLSYELALLRGVDPVEIAVIDRLKAALAQR